MVYVAARMADAQVIGKFLALESFAKRYTPCCGAEDAPCCGAGERAPVAGPIPCHVKIGPHVIDKSPPIESVEFDGRAQEIYGVRARVINSEDLNVLRDSRSPRGIPHVAARGARKWYKGGA